MPCCYRGHSRSVIVRSIYVTPLRILDHPTPNNDLQDELRTRRSWLIATGIGLATAPLVYLGVRETIGMSDMALRSDLHDLITKRFEKVIGKGSTFSLPNGTIVDCRVFSAEIRSEIIAAATNDVWPYYTANRRRSYRERIDDLFHSKAVGNWYIDTIVEHAVDARIVIAIEELLEEEASHHP